MQTNINNIVLREVFDKCYEKIKDTIENSIESKYLIRAFCGIGKSKLIYKSGLFNLLHNNISLFVFPTISIITQFNSNYIKNDL
jgi:hypothetical protein